MEKWLSLLKLKIIIKQDFIVDLAHFAFHFGEEVEKVLAGGKVPDFDITKPFSRKRLQ